MTQIYEQGEFNEENYGKCCDELSDWCKKWAPTFGQAGIGYAQVRSGVADMLMGDPDRIKGRQFLKDAIQHGLQDYLKGGFHDANM